MNRRRREPRPARREDRKRRDRRPDRNAPAAAEAAPAPALPAPPAELVHETHTEHVRAHGDPWPRIPPAIATALVALWGLVLALVAVLFARTPLYFVETDLIGEYIPAARELAHGTLALAHYSTHGPGYPAMLAALSLPLHGDLLLTAKLLSAIAMAAAIGAAFALTRLLLGEVIAAFTLLALLVAPACVRYALESGTDAPALALMLVSTWLTLRPGRMRARAAAGAAAALAILTRGNAVFLLPCALVTLAFSAQRGRMLLAYVLGAGVPLGAWWWIARMHGGLPADLNYLNVARELYGQGVPWDRFDSTIGLRFHSLIDVLRFDPPRAAARIAANLATQRLEDLRELTTWWLGVPAIAGIVFVARDRIARAAVLYSLLFALVLAPVFYNARFAIYLLPLYAASAGATFAWLARLAGGRLRVPAVVAGLVVLGACATLAVRGNAARIADAPVETRAGGLALRALGAPADRVLAQKPHSAYFADMAFVPLPNGPALRELPGWAERQGAHWLFFSGIEQVMRPEYGVLADSGVTLPGFEPVGFQRFGPSHFYALYRLHPTTTSAAEFDSSYRGQLARYEARHAKEPEALLFVAAQLLELNEASQALVRLERLEATGAKDAALERYRASALLATGDFARANDAITRAMQYESPTGWHYAMLGEILARQGRFTDASNAFDHALTIEPANIGYQMLRARVDLAAGEPGAAAERLMRTVALAPRDAGVRRMAVLAWRRAGDPQRAQAVIDGGIALGLEARAMEADSAASR